MRVIIVGGGKLGYKIAESLSQQENNVIVIDIDEKTLESINENLDVLTIKSNGVQIGTLEQLQIGDSDLIIAVTGSDESNILISIMARKMGCKKVIARIRNPEYASQVKFIRENMEIDYIVNPDLATSKEIAGYLLKNEALYIEDFAKGKIGMADFRVSNLKDIAGKKIKDLGLEGPLLIVAISRNGQIIIPHGNTDILSTDIIYLMGKRESINNFSQTHVGYGEIRRTKKVILIGGGRISYYLAKQLLEKGVDIKIIEKDRERCEYLAENIGGGLVIYGDGTDINLLLAENLADMDALVSLTGFDEENLMIALLAKQYGVDKIIAKVSRANYIPIIEKLGIDVAINPVLITASEILRMVRGGKIESISLLLGGQGETIEFIAQEGSKIVGRRLKDLNLPKGIIIAAILHGEEIIIPRGDSIIEAGSRVVAFCLQSEVVALENFFEKAKGGLINGLWGGYKITR